MSSYQRTAKYQEKNKNPPKEYFGGVILENKSNNNNQSPAKMIICPASSAREIHSSSINGYATAIKDPPQYQSMDRIFVGEDGEATLQEFLRTLQ